jgi:hypothetical protein
MIRDESEIQREHDRLAGILLDERIQAAIGLDEASREAIEVMAGVLCWVLRHDHNTAFEDYLLKLDEACRAVGFHLPATPNPPETHR